jgi:hypothetical protein
MMAQFFPDGAREGVHMKGMNLIQAVDIVRAVIYLLTEESAFINGANLPVGSGH